MKITINEGKRDEALSMFLPLFQKRNIPMNVSKLKQILLNKFVTEGGMHSLSQSSNFYLLGVARYYFNGDLTTNKRLNTLYPNCKDKFNSEICTRLDALVNILRNAYIDSVGTKFEQPEDFGNLSVQKLLKKYNRKINDALGITPNKTNDENEEQINDNYTCGKNYTYEILYSPEDAKKYNKATEPGAWCITYSNTHYNAYVKRLKIHYVIFKVNGYENVKRTKGPNWSKKKPQDAYGNSLIAVLQSNNSPEPIYITSRWNHGSHIDNSFCEADHAYTKEEFLNVIGDSGEVLQRCYEQWKANVKQKGQTAVNRKEISAKRISALRTFKYAQMMINGGAKINEYFTDIVPLNGNLTEKNKDKGTYMVSVTIDDERWATLIDRKQLYFNDIFIKYPYNPNFLVIHNDEKALVINDDTKKAYWIFDKTRHKLIDIDGIKKFKYTSLSRYSKSLNKPFIVAISTNQLALINARTMKPVRAKNGIGWFETIVIADGMYINNSNRKYNDKIDIPYIRDDTKLFRMVYDSSAGEEYIYNKETEKLIELHKDEGFELFGTINTSWLNDSLLMYRKITSNGSKNLYELKYLNTNETVTLSGENTFLEVSEEEGVIAYKTMDGNIHYMFNGKPLMFNGKELITNGSLSMSTFRGFIMISVNCENYYVWRKTLLYNKLTNTFYHDDISGYFFHIYGVGEVYYPQNKNDEQHTWKRYTIPTAEEDAKRIAKTTANVTENFKRVLKLL